MNTEAEASRIAALIDAAQLSKAFSALRDSLARSPGNPSLLKLASQLAVAAEGASVSLAYSKATDRSPKAHEFENIAKQAREYLTS